MDFVLLQTFNNYIDAHIAKGRLEAQNIICWLKDEHLSALLVDPVFVSAIAGIKLMVAREHVERATEILNEPPQLSEDAEEYE
ncbi:MAG TPA: DUF2007 domain-containing protein [Chitinophagaceae bacterium]|nr:DUF2007 domain-containing protein [Chitinophagaceae bacterium]